MDVVLDSAKRPAVYHFASGGSDASRSDFGDGAGGVVDGVEDGQQGFDSFGFASELHGDFGDEGQRALAADKEAAEVVARRVAVPAADAHDFAIGEHEFERGHMVDGDAIGQRVRTTGVFGDVAADGAGFLAGGIGSKIEAGVLDGASDIEIHDAGLDNSAGILEIELEDTVHPGKHDHDAAAARECAAREACSRAAADNGHVVLGRELDDARDIFRGVGEHDEVRARLFD